MVASRVMQCTEVPTTVLTSVYCDLMGDVSLFGGGSAKRDKRATGVVCMIAGGVFGRWINKAAGLEPGLWACGGVKVILVAVWWWWRTERKGTIRSDKCPPIFTKNQKHVPPCQYDLFLSGEPHYIPDA